MPAYGTNTYPFAIYPGQNAYLVGSDGITEIPNPFGLGTTSASTLTAATNAPGFPFVSGMATQSIIINGTTYTVNTVTDSTHLTTTTVIGTHTSPVAWSFPSYNPYSGQQFETISQGYHSMAVDIAPVFGFHGYTGRQIMWETAFSGTISTLSVTLEGALSDPVSNFRWTTIDTSTATAGESRQSVIIGFQHIRVTFGTLTGSNMMGIVRIRVM